MLSTITICVLGLACIRLFFYALQKDMEEKTLYKQYEKYIFEGRRMELEIKMLKANVTLEKLITLELESSITTLINNNQPNDAPLTNLLVSELYNRLPSDRFHEFMEPLGVITD